MSSDDTRRRMEYQAVGGALARLDTKDPQAAQLIAGLATVIIEEAERSSRFAGALTRVLDALRPLGDAADAEATPVVSSAPRKRAATPKKRAARQPGAFDPFVVYRDDGEQGLAAKLGELTVDQLRGIIAEQELETRKETGRKRTAEVLVAWIVDKVKASENKGSVFR